MFFAALYIAISFDEPKSFSVIIVLSEYYFFVIGRFSYDVKTLFGSIPLSKSVLRLSDINNRTIGASRNVLIQRKLPDVEERERERLPDDVLIRNKLQIAILVILPDRKVIVYTNTKPSTGYNRMRRD